jgi:hypothetical protein
MLWKYGISNGTCNAEYILAECWARLRIAVANARDCSFTEQSCYLDLGTRMTKALKKSKRTSFVVAALLILSMLSFSCWASVHGIVSNAVTHKPVGGVEIFAVSFGFSPAITVASTVSAADGSYKLKFLSGDYPIFANALGYADYSNFSAPGSGEFDIALTPVAAISGTVFDANSQPVQYPGVQVLDAMTGAYVTDAGGDETGKFSVNDIAPGDYMICVINAYDAYQDGCYDNQPIGADGLPHGTPVRVASGQFVTGLNIHLQTGATVSGTLTNRVTGGPIYAYPRFTFYTPAGVLLNSIDIPMDLATGAYSIVGLAPGSYYLVADEPFGFNSGYYPNVYGGADCDPTDPSGLPACSFTGVAPLTVPAQGLTNINFELSSGGTISGHVIDAATGLGIPTVQVNVCTLPNYYATAGGITDANGYYAFTHVLQHFVVSTRASGYMDQVWPNTLYDDGITCASDDPQSFLTLPTQTATINGIDFSLSKGSHVSGTVSGIQGMPAHVAFFVFDGYPPTFLGDVAANADGSFETGDLTTLGDYTAIAYLDDGETCVFYGDHPCGPSWQVSNPSSADFSVSKDFSAGSGTVILNLDFHLTIDRVFSNGFE